MQKSTVTLQYRKAEEVFGNLCIAMFCTLYTSWREMWDLGNDSNVQMYMILGKI
jgi:hypothetical protein